MKKDKPSEEEKQHKTDQEITEYPKGKFGSPFGILNRREKIIKKHI